MNKNEKNLKCCYCFSAIKNSVLIWGFFSTTCGSWCCCCCCGRSGSKSKHTLWTRRGGRGGGGRSSTSRLFCLFARERFLTRQRRCRCRRRRSLNCNEGMWDSQLARWASLFRCRKSVRLVGAATTTTATTATPPQQQQHHRRHQRSQQRKRILWNFEQSGQVRNTLYIRSWSVQF